MLAVVATLALAQSSRVDVGFCNSDGSGFLREQPPDQLERWSLPVDNGSHLVIDWRPHASVCGRNVSAYYVDVKTSVPVLNFFVGMFGSFPQNICDPAGSKARDAVNVEEVNSPGTCSACTATQRRTSFEVPAALVKVAAWDIEVTVTSYGSHAPIGQPQHATPGTWWCHKYRRLPKATGGGGSTQQPTSTPPARSGLVGAARALIRSARDAIARVAARRPRGRRRQ